MNAADSKRLAEQLRQHIEDSCDSDRNREEKDKAIADKIDKLMPLVDLIPIIETLAEERKTNIAVNERFAYIARVVITIGGVIAAIFGIIQLIFRLER